MPAPTSNLDRTTLRELLAVERDAHLRQRELVRASLLHRPGEPAGRRPGSARV